MQPTGAGFLKNLLARSNRFVLQTNSKELHAPYLGYSKYGFKCLGFGAGLLVYLTNWSQWEFFKSFFFYST